MRELLAGQRRMLQKRKKNYCKAVPWKESLITERLVERNTLSNRYVENSLIKTVK